MAISRARKRRLKSRARRQAARENVVSNPSAAIGQANRQYGRDVSDARGATRVQKSQLSNMLGRTGQMKGLTRRDRSALRLDLRSRISEANAGLPYAVGLAQEARRDSVADARSTVADERAARQEAAGNNFTDLLDQVRDNQADRRKDRKENSGVSEGVKNALIVANTYLKNAKPGEREVLLKDPGSFALAVAKDAENADQVDAKRAVAILMRRFKRSKKWPVRELPLGGRR